VTEPFPPDGRLIHIANVHQWDALANVFDETGVRLIEYPSGPGIKDFSGVPVYVLMLKETDDD